MAPNDNRHVITVTDPAALAATAAEHVLARTAANTGRVAICLTGGSSPKQLYQLLATDAYRSRIPWQRVHWFIGDERFVAAGDALHNMTMARKAFLDACAPPANVHPIPTSAPDPTEAARLYEEELKEFYGRDRLDPARPLFDVVLTGRMFIALIVAHAVAAVAFAVLLPIGRPWVAVLALLPPWVLLYLVSGWQGVKGGWPLAVVGSLGYIAGQYPVAVHLGPYLPDVSGAIVCFIALLILLKVWQPKSVLGYGGVPVDAATARQTQGHGLKFGEVLQAWLPFAVLLVVVAAWTGPWSPLPKVSWFKTTRLRASSLPSASIL